MLHETQQKEQFNIAFMRAVISVAGYNILRMEVDDDSVDISVRGNRRDGNVRKAPQLDIQAKCTETDGGTGPSLPFDLKLKNYDDLRAADVHVPAILVVLWVPQDVAQWMSENADQTVLRRCAYWMSLQSMGPTTNATGQRVHIPRSQQFTSSSLRDIMVRIGNGGAP